MNKFIAECRNNEGKLLARFDNNSGNWLTNYFKNMFPSQELRIFVVLNRFIEGKFKYRAKHENNCAKR